MCYATKATAAAAAVALPKAKDSRTQTHGRRGEGGDYCTLLFDADTCGNGRKVEIPID